MNTTFTGVLIALLSLAACLGNSCKKSNPSRNPTLRIAIPQGSGEIFVDYKIFEIRNDSLYVMNRMTQVGQDDIDSLYRYDTTARHKVSNETMLELENLIASIDTLGNHQPDGYFLPMGWPRFSIVAGMKGKSLQGSISNCYRENHFKLLDFMNKTCPEGAIIPYDRQKLIELEKSIAEKQN